MLHSFHVALFSYCALFMLHFFHIALFSCCSFSLLHYFHAAFLCCTLFMFHFLRVALFSCCTVTRYFLEHVFFRKLRSDCLFFMCCVKPVISKFYQSIYCQAAQVVNFFSNTQIKCECFANMIK